jgi:hypothetical protein
LCSQNHITHPLPRSLSEPPLCSPPGTPRSAAAAVVVVCCSRLSLVARPAPLGVAEVGEAPA